MAKQIDKNVFEVYLKGNERRRFVVHSNRLRKIPGREEEVDEKLNDGSPGDPVVNEPVISSDNMDGDQDDETERKDDSPQIDQNKRAGYLRSGRRFK